MLLYTHIYDLILKLITLFGLIVLLAECSFFNERVVLLLSVFVVLFLTLYYFLIRTVGSWLYCRINLKMKLSLLQAAKLNAALSPIAGTWLPMLEIKNIKQEDKYNFALHLYENWKQK